MFRLLFHIYLAKVAIGIRLMFQVAGCAMVIHQFFLIGPLNRLGDCDWLFALGHAMVIRPICLVLCNRESHVGWLAIFTRFSCCDSNSPVFSGRNVIRHLLLDADSLGWFDCLLVDNLFTIAMRPRFLIHWLLSQN